MRKLTFVALVFALAFFGSADVESQQQGGELIIGMGAEPEALDPVEMQSAPAGMVALHATETLINADQEGNLMPGLAKDWEFSDDATEMTLELREDVVFHDGEPFNAQAAKFNLDRFRERAVFGVLLEPVEEVVVVDEYTLRIETGEPFAPLPAHLTHDFVAMLSPASTPADGTVETPVGTGPFEITEWRRGEAILAERFDDYWGDAPRLDSLRWRFIPEPGARVAALEAGEVHTIQRVPPADRPRLEDDDSINVVEAPSVRTIYMGFHTQREPFTNKTVRQALNYCVNKEGIVENVLDGIGRVSDAPMSPGLFGYAPQDVYEHDPERGREMLAEAGFPDGFEVDMFSPAGRYLQDTLVAEAVQANLAECGIEADLTTLEFATYLDTIQEPNPEDAPFDLYLLGWGCITLDADYCLFNLFHSGEWPPAANNSYYANDEVDALLEEGRTTADTERRREIYEEVNGILWEEAPWIFLHSESQLNAELDSVNGLIHDAREFIDATDAYLEE